MNGFVVTRTWHLEDECGNAAADQVQTITVEDTLHPWFTRAPKNDTAYCEDDVDARRLSFKAYPRFTDNCTTVSMDVALDSIDTLCNNKSTIEYYTFTLTDACGLTTIAKANFYTLDTTPPELTGPWLDVYIEDCANSVADYLSWKNSVHVRDLCNDTAWLVDYDSVVEILTPYNCSTSFIEHGVWYYTDGCNVDSVKSIFTINDNTPPYVLVPPQLEVEVECDGHGNLDSLRNWINSVVYYDDCDGDNVVVEVRRIVGADTLMFSDTSALIDGKHYWGWQGTDCDGKYTFEFRAKDCKENWSTPVVEYFRIIDRVGPQFTAPDNDTVDCSNWEADFLTNEQKKYAALDAWATRRIYTELENFKNKNNKIPAKEL